MGLIVAQIRQMYLINSKIDLEYKLQMITQARMGLSQSVDDLINMNDSTPDNPMNKVLAQRQAKLKILEQKLELQSKQYQNQLQMIETELKSCEGMIQSSIQTAFSYGR